ncbi:DUF3772 domain-containing protein [Sphingomonas sp. NCPPB 2930]
MTEPFRLAPTGSPAAMRPHAAPATARRPAHRAAHWQAWLWALCCTVLLVLGSAGAHAAPPDAPPPTTDEVLDAARKTLQGVQKQLEGEVPDTTLLTMRGAVLQAQAQAEQTAADLEPALAKVQARLAELGAAPDAKAAEAPDVAEQRATLEKDRKQIDAQVKLARLLSVEGTQTADQIAERRRAQFTAQIGERTASILGAPFWRELRASLPRDLARLQQAAAELKTAAGATPPGVWLALLLGAAGAVALRYWAVRLLLRFTSQRVPAGRLRRSLLALALTVLNVAAPAVVVHLLRLGFTSYAALSDPLERFLLAGVGMVCFGAFVAGLGDALLSRRRPSWRLPPIADSEAAVMHGYPLLLAIVLVGSWGLDRLTVLLNTGLATAVAQECMSALLMGLVLAWGLHRFEKQHRHELAAARAAAAQDECGSAAPATTPWTTVLAKLVWVAMAASFLCLLVGYVAVGSFIVKQLVWIAIVSATVYLLNALIDDAFVAWLGSPRGDADASAQAPGVRMRAQWAVLLSAVGRLAVLLFAVVLIAAPFGQGPVELVERAGSLRDGVAIGAVRLQPSTVLQAIAVFVFGTIAVRLAQRWLRDRLLPTTGLDAAMRDSAVTLLGTMGTIAALAFALSAIGLGLERIAWVASALSVGIGFGLQAVVSNFVSGLILLAERPVKVGDWVSLSGVEGDIRRINVRATEIQMGDRSTVIVPNSEFITKIVRNVTLANPLGQVSFKLPMALDADVVQVREIILAAFAANEGVLDTPEPKVFLESVETERLIFAANGAVSSPRQAYAVKSALLFDVLARLRAIGQFPARAAPPADDPLAPDAPVQVPPLGAPPTGTV